MVKEAAAIKAKELKTDRLSNATRQYVRTMLKVHEAGLVSKDSKIDVSLPITKGGRFPLINC